MKTWLNNTVLYPTLFSSDYMKIVCIFLETYVEIDTWEGQFPPYLCLVFRAWITTTFLNLCLVFLSGFLVLANIL